VKGGGVRHRIEPHTAGPAGVAVEEGPGPVGGPKARRLCTVGGCKGVEDLGGQPCELRGCHSSKALDRREAQFGELSMQEVPARKRCAGWCGKGCRWVVAAARAEAARAAVAVSRR
jgi:hypothetical protein